MLAYLVWKDPLSIDAKAKLSKNGSATLAKRFWMDITRRLNDIAGLNGTANLLNEVQVSSTSLSAIHHVPVLYKLHCMDRSRTSTKH